MAFSPQGNVVWSGNGHCQCFFPSYGSVCAERGSDLWQRLFYIVKHRFTSFLLPHAGRSLGEVGDGVVLDAVFFFLFSLFSGVVSSGASWGMLLFSSLLVALTTGICGNDSLDSEGGGSLTVYSAALRALCCCTMERSFGEVRDGAVLDAVFFFSFLFFLGVANAVFLVVFVGVITLAFSATCSTPGAFQKVVLSPR